MSDSELLDKLEAYVRSDNVGNGLVIFPSTNRTTGLTRICLQDLGDEDGSNLGDELTELKATLREAIEALP